MQTAFGRRWSRRGSAPPWARTARPTAAAEIDDIAPPNGWVTLRCAFGRAFAFGRVSTFLDHDEPGPTELVRPGYTLFDLGGGWRLSDALELRLTVRNAGDKLYTAAADNAADRAPGRSVTLALSGRL